MLEIPVNKAISEISNYFHYFLYNSCIVESVAMAWCVESLPSNPANRRKFSGFHGQNYLELLDDNNHSQTFTRTLTTTNKWIKCNKKCFVTIYSVIISIIHLSHGCANHVTEGETLQSSIHCCDVTNPPYLFSGELCTSSLHCKCLFVYTVCCWWAVCASLCSEDINQMSYWRSGRQ